MEILHIHIRIFTFRTRLVHSSQAATLGYKGTSSDNRLQPQEAKVRRLATVLGWEVLQRNGDFLNRWSTVWRQRC